MDHMRRKTMKMDHVHTIVLDEADEMLNMGFREDIETILEGIHRNTRQCFFCDNAKGNLRDHKTVPDKCGTGEGDEERADRSEH